MKACNTPPPPGSEQWAELLGIVVISLWLCGILKACFIIKHHWKKLFKVISVSLSSTGLTLSQQKYSTTPAWFIWKMAFQWTEHYSTCNTCKHFGVSLCTEKMAWYSQHNLQDSHLCNKCDYLHNLALQYIKQHLNHFPLILALFGWCWAGSLFFVRLTLYSKTLPLRSWTARWWCQTGTFLRWWALIGWYLQRWVQICWSPSYWPLICWFVRFWAPIAQFVGVWLSMPSVTILRWFHRVLFLDFFIQGI